MPQCLLQLAIERWHRNVMSVEPLACWLESHQLLGNIVHEGHYCAWVRARPNMFYQKRSGYPRPQLLSSLALCPLHLLHGVSHSLQKRTIYVFPTTHLLLSHFNCLNKRHDEMPYRNTIFKSHEQSDPWLLCVIDWSPVSLDHYLVIFSVLQMAWHSGGNSPPDGY